MKHYIDERGNYYVGDKANRSHIEVTERLNHLHKWNGSEWVIDADLVSKEYKKELSSGDIAYIRVIDDVVKLLIDKGVIELEELPPKVQLKYNDRKELRDKIK